MPRVDPLTRELFLKARRSELRYGSQLRKVARHIADIINGHAVDTEQEASAVVQALQRYANLIAPWAKRVGARMLAEVSLRDAKAWEQYTKQMGIALRDEIRNAPTGNILRELLDNQVSLITSLPTEAAQRVHELTTEALSTGARPATLAQDIYALGGITKNRATLIARTEVARSSSGLTQARAQFMGSEGYIWRTVKDTDVRSSHRKMEGKFIRWDSPPIVDPGVAPYHAGCIYNCRCYPEPVVPSDF